MQLGWSINYPCTGMSICASGGGTGGGGASPAMELFYNGATFIKLVIAKKLQIESLTRTKLIFARSQLTEANVKCRSWIRYKLPKLPAAAASVGGLDQIEYVTKCTYIKV